MKTDTLVLGAGLAGLSTAYHLRGLDPRRSILVVEKRRSPGGAAGSVRQDGFTFDHTGHLLHLHDPYGKALILDLLKSNVAVHRRDTWVYSHGTYSRYPFQANTKGLPDKVVEDCVVGFMKTVHRPAPLRPSPSFKEWSLATFGEGISRHFMFPYNSKLWRIPLERLTTEWQGRFVPKPAPEEVLFGALADQEKGFGYNATFRYPKKGGSQSLCDALAARVPGVRLGCPVTRIDLREKVAVIEGLGEVRYERLVSTLPLPELLDLAEELPASVRLARALLRWVSVYNLNIGVARAKMSEKHWVYFPESRFPFYRAGWTSNFSPDLAPKGTSSMYIEVSRDPGTKVDLPRLEGQILDGLKACGILRPSDKLATRLWLPIPCAYVVYDLNRTRALKAIFPYLSSRGVESIGRWGGWKYSFMEETILDGKRCAERLVGRQAAVARVSHDELVPLK